MHSNKMLVTVTRIRIPNITDLEHNKYDNSVTTALNLFLHLSFRDPHPKRTKGVEFLHLSLGDFHPNHRISVAIK